MVVGTHHDLRLLMQVSYQTIFGSSYCDVGQKIPEERVTIEDVCVFLRRAGESHHAPVEAVRA